MFTIIRIQEKRYVGLPIYIYLFIKEPNCMKCIKILTRTKFHFQHFMLIEFSSEENLQSILQSCCSHQKDLEVMAVQSPFVWFRAASDAKQKLTANGLELRVKDGNNKHSEDLLFEDLMKCQTVSEQIQMLYDKTILNDVGARLRFMVARQVSFSTHGRKIHVNICFQMKTNIFLI